ncbi:MAG TPA: hypothetical protein VFS41_02335, partial [Edaphobacter sp.]|nr:hypothetical protein [Edaphobacter sp.]
MRDRTFLRGISLILPVSRILFLLPASLLLLSAPVFAAASAAASVNPPGIDLPDSPGALVTAAGVSSSLDSDEAVLPDGAGMPGPGQQNMTTTNEPVLLPRVKFVPANHRAPQQHVHDKIALGFRESITPFSMVGWVASAGWSHLLNSAPNYGVNSEAFAQRLGAAAATGASKEIFSDAVFAPLLRQDPRYYQLGRSHTFINRALYAGTRPVIGRTDSGRQIFNFAGVLGTGASAALTQAYYPDENV